MFQNYDEALQWIHSRLRLGMKPGLERMKWMMERLGHPEKKLKCIHIGGTNGKGSTVTYLSSILQESGMRIGTFTSPYFEHFNERISINGCPISDDDLVVLTNVFKPLAEELEETDLGGPTEFEIITGMSFYYFAEMQKVDFALYEVGLGGRFDSTNILQPILSIITSIGLDHTEILGDTYEQIAFEKAGIIKEDVPVITGVKQTEALNVIKDTAKKAHSPLYTLGREMNILNHSSQANGERFSVATDFGHVDHIFISMIGMHQTENAALAVTAAQFLEIRDEDIISGISKAYWPGRFDVISTEPLIIMDGAHNEEGTETLVKELQKRYGDKEIHIVFGALSDKRLNGMIRRLDSVASMITFVEFDFPRAAKAMDLASYSCHPQKNIVSNWREAISEEINQLTSPQILVITGSLYFLSQAKPYVREMLNRNSQL